MRFLQSAALLGCLAPALLAQGFNVDVGPQLILAPVPASSFGGAGGQPGHWNGFQPGFNPAPLADLSGQPTAVTLYTDTTSSVTQFPSVIPAGGDQALMEDYQWSGGLGATVTFRFEGLEPGVYRVIVYGIDPSGGSDLTEVSVLGSPDPPQALSGPWPGMQVAGTTYSVHDVACPSGILELQLAGLNPFPNDRTVCNGLQLVPASAIGQSFCGPAVANSTGASGALVALGSTLAAENQCQLVAEDLPSNQFGFFLASTTQGFVTGPGASQGNLCLGGTIARFNNPVLSSGAAGRMSLLVDLQAIPLNPAVAVQAGETWSFQGWYRDANPQATSNFTNGRAVTFQ